MKEKDLKTEAHIKQTAKHVFFAQGRFDAKMHEIADAGKINRALLHYYFRNRENLFHVVLEEAMEESFIKMFQILTGKELFEIKVEKAILHLLDCLSEYPFIETFIISELNKTQGKSTLTPIAEGKKFAQTFMKEIQIYLKKNKLTYITPQHFLVNMMALCTYPSSTQPIVRQVLGLQSDRSYKAFLAERKKILPRLVLMK